MKVALDAIHARLTAAGVAATLASYKGSRALFTSDEVPPDCPRPYGTIYGPVSAVDFDTKSGHEGSIEAEDCSGYILTFDCSFYADERADQSDVEAIALAARRALHRKAELILPSGYNVIWSRATGITPPPVDQQLSGRTFELQLALRPVSE